MYTTATVIENTDGQDGNPILLVEFTGDAGEAPKREYAPMAVIATALQLRQWVKAIFDALNSRRTLAKIAALQVGQVIAPANTAAPVPTAEEVWLEKARRLVRVTAIGLTAAQAVTDLAALKADVNGTYQSVYLTKL
jgi:hypothetical protein